MVACDGTGTLDISSLFVGRLASALSLRTIRAAIIVFVVGVTSASYFAQLWFDDVCTLVHCLVAAFAHLSDDLVIGFSLGMLTVLLMIAEKLLKSPSVHIQSKLLDNRRIYVAFLDGIVIRINRETFIEQAQALDHASDVAPD